MVHAWVDSCNVSGGWHVESALFPVRDALRFAAFGDNGVVVCNGDAGCTRIGRHRCVLYGHCRIYDVFDHEGRFCVVARCAVCLDSALRGSGRRIAWIDQWRAGASAESAFADRDYWHAVFVSRLAADVRGYAVFHEYPA